MALWIYDPFFTTSLCCAGAFCLFHIAAHESALKTLGSKLFKSSGKHFLAYSVDGSSRVTYAGKLAKTRNELRSQPIRILPDFVIFIQDKRANFVPIQEMNLSN